MAKLEPRRPPLGNGREDSLFDEWAEGWGRHEGPESQGEYAGTGYGDVAQGGYGDESYDPAYQRDEEPEPAERDAEASDRREQPSEHEGPGRGADGGEWVSQDPAEPSDMLLREIVDEMQEERRRDDLAIRDDVRDLLAEAGGRDLEVTVKRGAVTLCGLVRDQGARLQARRLIAAVPGVVEIDDRLRVQSA